MANQLITFHTTRAGSVVLENVDPFHMEPVKEYLKTLGISCTFLSPTNVDGEFRVRGVILDPKEENNKVNFLDEAAFGRAMCTRHDKVLITPESEFAAGKRIYCFLQHIVVKTPKKYSEQGLRLEYLETATLKWIPTMGKVIDLLERHRYECPDDVASLRQYHADFFDKIQQRFIVDPHEYEALGGQPIGFLPCVEGYELMDLEEW